METEELFEVPNLDGMDRKDLEATYDVLSTLSRYAEMKLMAMMAREAGLIERALMYEDRCDEHYRRLPEWARW